MTKAIRLNPLGAINVTAAFQGNASSAYMESFLCSELINTTWQLRIEIKTYLSTGENYSENFLGNY